MVTPGAQARDISAPPAGQEPRPLGKVRTLHKRCYEPRYLPRVSGTIRIDHGYHVTGRCLKTAGQGVALALPGLGHHAHVRPQLAGDRHRVVNRAAIHEHHLVNVLRNPLEHMRDIPLFVKRRDNHRYRRRNHGPIISLWLASLSETAAARSPNTTGTAAHTAPSPLERSGTSRLATAHSVRSRSQEIFSPSPAVTTM